MTGPLCLRVLTYESLFVSHSTHAPSLDPDTAMLCSALTSSARTGPSCPKSLANRPARTGLSGLSCRHARTTPLLVPQKRLVPAAAHTVTSSSVPASGAALATTFPPLRLQTRMLPSQCPQLTYSAVPEAAEVALEVAVLVVVAENTWARWGSVSATIPSGFPALLLSTGVTALPFALEGDCDAVADVVDWDEREEKEP